MAFLGGLYRWIDDKSHFGVHTLYADNDLGSDVDQQVSSQIIEYMKEMGVDAALFSEMAKAGGDEINILSSDRLRHLGVTNGPFNETVWTIASIGEGLYFKGERVTWRGFDKFIVTAGPKGTLLHTIFDPEGRGQEATQMLAHSLFVDDGAHPIEPFGEPQLINGMVNCFYGLTPELLEMIKKAKTVGVALQWTRQAPVFLGFNYMEIEGGRSLLLGLPVLVQQASVG